MRLELRFPNSPFHKADVFWPELHFSGVRILLQLEAAAEPLVANLQKVF